MSYIVTYISVYIRLCSLESDRDGHTTETESSKLKKTHKKKTRRKTAGIFMLIRSMAHWIPHIPHEKAKIGPVVVSSIPKSRNNNKPYICL